MYSIMMMAAVLAAAPTPKVIAGDPDVQCYMAMSLAMAGLEKSGEAKAEEVTGLTALAWYYYGRMEAKYPDVDFAPGIADLTSAPGYVANQLQKDAARCGAEAEGKGKAMQELGQRLQEMAQIAEGRAS